MRALRRNADPTARELYAVAVDAVKQANLTRGDKAKRKELLAQAKALYEEGQELDRVRIRDARTPKFTPAATPVPDELSQWSGLPKQDEVTIDGLAALIGVDEYDKIRDRNDDYVGETAHQLWEGGDVNDDAIHEQFMETFPDVENEYVFKPWHDGVLSAAEKMFEDHGLALHPMGRPRGASKGSPKGAAWRPYMFRIAPTTAGWRVAASMIYETINGVGHFSYGSLKEFLDSGPYSAREAVLGHLGWMRRYPEVVGDRSYESIYERAWR